MKITSLWHILKCLQFSRAKHKSCIGWLEILSVSVALPWQVRRCSPSPSAAAAAAAITALRRVTFHAKRERISLFPFSRSRKLLPH